MKTILIFFSIITFALSAPLDIVTKADTTVNSRENVSEDVFTFDGYEGGYYFFTDANDEALILEANHKSDENIKLLMKNNKTGKKFKVAYEVDQIDNSSSAEGILLRVEKV